MDNDSEVLAELRLIRSLAAAQLFYMLDRAEMTQVDKIEVLGKAGLSARDIAGLLSTTPNTVSVAMSKLRKQKRLPTER